MEDDIADMEIRQSEKYYVVDFDKIQTLEDLKRVLKVMRLVVWGGLVDEIRDLLIEE